MRQNPHVRICGGARVSNDPGLPDLGILPLPATFADAHGLPSGDRIRGQPHGDIASLDQRSVVSQVDFRGRYFVPAVGPGFFGAGVRASMRPTIHSTSRSVSVTPAAIAGDILSDL